ncbi:universal stress protein [Gloeobacter kilaueensis]|uniref:Universal stress protein F n=1 Tax=Gloeobacter kilaueensis (strain ATCC BAA-2537 / CCAP 1431/1 / ULC 316 / JS1) TaxID=1183438 RepID=U5QLL7_GLOK1|nr:universal stress protein [Gloeobacter kilaueensis]AGY58504.1 universal stress protein F [Gloeobacter kilaueensis JS1]
MYARILAALDSSTKNEAVFLKALELAQGDRAALLLVHILSGDEGIWANLPVADTYPLAADGTVYEYFQRQWQQYQKFGLDMLQGFAERATGQGVHAEVRQQAGNPGRCLCELASSWQADLVVMGRRGHSGLSELLLGSASNYVLHHAPCSVLVVSTLQPAAAQST